MTKLSLRNRIYMILAALVSVTLAGGLIMVWYTYRMESLLTHIIDKDMAAFQAAEALEAALVNQKGFVSYYFLDGDPDWLRRLGEYRQIFKERLGAVWTFAESDEQRRAIEAIRTEYAAYITTKDQVISFYKAGQREAGAKLHPKARDYFFRILNSCEEYKTIHKKRIMQAREETRVQAIRLRIIGMAAMFVVFFLAVALIFVLVRYILSPVRKLAAEAGGEDISSLTDNEADDEIKALSRGVRGLIKDAGQVHIELERSREHLLQSEKMAMVGKLAAGTAHSIRNPLTSVKMRLFSLSRSLELSNIQKEDFDVISEEIRHIDTILQNFLEFSRPPKLKMQRISPSVVVDLAIQLLEHRLKSYDVKAKVIRQQPLPEIQADPEQLKEVLVNLMVNACESMEKGGHIIITEEATLADPPGKLIIIRLSDNGPGIPEAMQKKIFEPFFTTKEEGTGLGLSIASRIIEEHQGWMDVVSEEEEGTTFVIRLPVSG